MILDKPTILNWGNDDVVSVIPTKLFCKEYLLRFCWQTTLQVSLLTILQDLW